MLGRGGALQEYTVTMVLLHVSTAPRLASCDGAVVVKADPAHWGHPDANAALSQAPAGTTAASVVTKLSVDSAIATTTTAATSDNSTARDGIAAARAPPSTSSAAGPSAIAGFAAAGGADGLATATFGNASIAAPTTSTA